MMCLGELISKICSELGDVFFNPQKDDQAKDETYRLGQSCSLTY